MKKILFLFIFFTIHQIFSQVTPEQEASLADIMLNKINVLRKQKGIYALQRDNNLKDAGKLQADFMATKKQTLHTNENELYATATKRVL